jgi:anaerobic selenocysteine-containing dehydrogenase
MDVEDNRIVEVRPDYDDPHSAGYVCPKGMAIADVHNDPDRIRRPMRKKADGKYEEIGWDEAFDLVGEKLNTLRDAHGPDSIAVYYGNPLGHNYSGIMMVDPLVKAIGTRNRTGASSQDTAPRFAASYYLYGNTIVIPTPDIENTDWFLFVVANPAVSQGSAMVTPNVKSKLKGIRERGGKIITVDPRFTETSKIADEHVAIRPGGDAAFLLSMLWVLIEEGLIDREAIESQSTGWEDVARRTKPFAPERVESECGGKRVRHRRRDDTAPGAGVRRFEARRRLYTPRCLQQSLGNLGYLGERRVESGDRTSRKNRRLDVRGADSRHGDDRGDGQDERARPLEEPCSRFA